MCSGCGGAYEGEEGVWKNEPPRIGIDKEITVKGNWIVCPFCFRKWQRGIDSLAGDIIECRCGKNLEVEAVER